MKIALIGASGIVGASLIDVFNSKAIRHNIKLFASSTKENKINVLGKEQTVFELTKDSLLQEEFDLAFFCADEKTASVYAPLLTNKHTVCIDNSSYYRLASAVLLIVPEVNGELIYKHNYIIANPNCSTIQIMPTLSALDKEFGLKRVVASTYQAVSGAGKEGLLALKEHQTNPTCLPCQIYDNCIPQIGDFTSNGYTKEEMKVIDESRKILNLKNLPITCTAVRVPVANCHSISLNVQLEHSFTLPQIKKCLSNQSGIVLFEEFAYPTPLETIGKTQTYVGRLRLDYSLDNTINMWIVADNLLKGAAYNAYQIGEYFFGG
ncbi:MAG: aspartate-semialdehyde dehydrogenase [Clostridia bacterium]